MNLAELKEETLDTWEAISGWRGDVLQPSAFLPEVATYGDLGDKQTWVKAFANFEAILFHSSCLDAWSLIVNDFNFTPDRSDYEYRHEILEAFLQYKDGLDLINLGLEQLVGPDFTAQEREQAHGFYRLVQEQCERGNGLPAGLTGRLPTVAGEAPSRSHRRIKGLPSANQGKRRQPTRLSASNRRRNRRTLRRVHRLALQWRRRQARRSRHFTSQRPKGVYAQ